MIYAGRGLATLCPLLGYSRQAYYKGQRHKDVRMAFHTIVAELVIEIRKRIDNQKLGARKLLPLIKEELDNQKLSIGRDQLFDIMESYGLKVRQRRRRKPATTDSTHGFKRYPNLVKGLSLSAAEQAWVSDMTYIRVKDRFMYLSLITDAYSRKIMGYCLYENLSVEGPMSALLMAISHRQYPTHKLIHHSDQGVQYCAHTYVNMLKTNGISISMAAKGSPHENALAERVNGILKQEYGLGKTLEGQDKAYQITSAAIASYNTKRPHLSIDGYTPEQKHGEDNWNQDLSTEVSTNSRSKTMDVNRNKD